MVRGVRRFFQKVSTYCGKGHPRTAREALQRHRLRLMVRSKHPCPRGIGMKLFAALVHVEPEEELAVERQKTRKAVTGEVHLRIARIRCPFF